jgi:hypothetical protein
MGTHCSDVAAAQFDEVTKKWDHPVGFNDMAPMCKKLLQTWTSECAQSNQAPEVRGAGASPLSPRSPHIATPHAVRGH